MPKTFVSGASRTYPTVLRPAAVRELPWPPMLILSFSKLFPRRCIFHRTRVGPGGCVRLRTHPGQRDCSFQCSGCGRVEIRALNLGYSGVLRKHKISRGDRATASCQRICPLKIHGGSAGRAPDAGAQSRLSSRKATGTRHRWPRPSPINARRRLPLDRGPPGPRPSAGRLWRCIWIVAGRISTGLEAGRRDPAPGRRLPARCLACGLFAVPAAREAAIAAQ